jgi:predicted ABC-type sugar transport system permease subunit
MSFDETNSDDFGEAPLPEESNNNRTFMIAVGILGGIILISVACLGAVYVFSKQNRATTQQTDAANAATQTAVAVQAVIDQSLTATFVAAIKPTTTSTVPPTPTPPVAPASPTSTPDPANPLGLVGTQAAATATVGAAYTQAALAAQFTVAPTTTALAGTGFADEYGLPGLVVMALAFVIVILFARRLRIAPETKR